MSSMIDRKAWVTRHDPVLTSADPATPLTIGNGSFAFTADISGLQSLSAGYAAVTPLCTLADWGWHSTPAPVPGGRYTPDDVQMDVYDFCGREVRYAVSRFPGNEHVYDWLRQNPHKAHLARIGLRLNGAELTPEDFAGVQQRLHLYEGTLVSRYALRGAQCCVTAACAPDRDALALRIECPLLPEGLSVDLDLPYGAPDITCADWASAERHSTVLTDCVIRRRMDDLRYAIRIDAPGAAIRQVGPHRIRVTADAPVLDMAVTFSQEGSPAPDAAADIRQRCSAWWADFWERGGAMDFSGAADPRAMEMERRIVLSMYLLAVNSSGRMPPAETGLICNSWYGKAHLEMHFWHMAWAPLWGHGELLARSLPWYHAHLPQARENAARNGYRGARWPKMVAEDAVDSPSPIAVLLVWQQPHIIVLLDMLRRELAANAPSDVPAFLRAHWPLIRETADFMADYAVPDAQGVYHIEPPVIPVQERFDPAQTRDPAFEVAYWRFGLGLAIDWAEALGEGADEGWRDVHAHMAPPPCHGGLYTAHANAPDTFRTTAEDHPSMLQCLGMLPGEGLDRQAMTRTLATVLDVWDMEEMWGWDFAVMAMTALRLGQPRLAAELLLSPASKNTYVASGNNRQSARADLPLYLPGNGSLLLAAAMMAAGYDGSAPCPGFRAEDGWAIRHEGLLPWF